MQITTRNHTGSGMHYFLDGLQLICQPGLRRFVVIPLLINIILFMVFFVIARHFMSEFNQWFVAHVPIWLQWLSTVLWVLFFASFFLILVYTFVTLANLVCAPFNSFLAEKVELFLQGALPEKRSLMDNLRDIPRIVGRQLSILGYYLPRAFVLLILFFIPVVQAIAPILWFLFNAWFMALTYIDYPTDNHRVPISQVRDWLKQKRHLSLSFGIIVLVASMIPILNLVTIPAAVAGATKLWLRERST